MGIDEQLKLLESLAARPKAERMPDHFTDIYSRLVELEKQPLTTRQRVRTLLDKGALIADMEVSDFRQVTNANKDARITGHDVLETALAASTQALAETQHIGDDALEGRVQRFRGQLFRRLDKFGRAAEAYRASVRLLQRAMRGPGVADPSVASDLLKSIRHLIGLEYMLGDLPAAQSWWNGAVEFAQHLTANGSAHAPLDLATMYWYQALLSRADGDPVKALSSVLQATEDYEHRPPSISKTRVLALAAEILLDAAESQKPDEPLREVYHGQAWTYCELAEAAAEAAMDVAGREMAILSKARYAQILKPTKKVPVNQVRAVLARTHEARSWDFALEVDSYISLGRLFVLREEPAEAKHAFEQAVKVAREHGAPGSASYAKDQLLTLGR